MSKHAIQWNNSRIFGNGYDTINIEKIYDNLVEWTQLFFI